MRALASDIPYVFSGAVEVEAGETVVKNMIAGVSAKVIAPEDGTVSGEGREREKLCSGGS